MRESLGKHRRNEERKMKGIAPFIMIGILVVLFAGIGLYATANGTTFQAMIGSLTGVIGTNPPQYIEVPSYGHIECKADLSATANNPGIIGPTAYDAGSVGGNPQKWSTTVSVPGNTPFANQIGLSITCVKSNFFGVGCAFDSSGYTIISPTGVAGTFTSWGGGAQISGIIQVGQTSDFWLPSASYPTGTTVYMQVTSAASLTAPQVTVNSKIKYTPYYLQQTDSAASGGAVTTLNPLSCTMPSYIPQGANDKIAPQLCVSGCSDNNNPIGTSLKFGPPGNVWNYVGGYLTIDSALNAVTYQNTPAFCKHGASGSQVTGSAIVYNLKTIKTPSQTYYVLGDIIGQPPCCSWVNNPETQPGKICTNFAWVANTNNAGTCGIGGSVSTCEGGGAWTINYADTTGQGVKMATGCDASNNCIYQTKKVLCTTAAQCQAGQTCTNSVCITTNRDNTPISSTQCGNGICDAALGETATGCPADCGAIPLCGNGIKDSGETAANCPNDFPNNWLAGIEGFILLWAVGTVLAGLLIAVLAIFMPIGILKVIITRPLYLLGAAVLFGLLIALLFGVQIQPAANLAASLVSGVSG